MSSTSVLSSIVPDLSAISDLIVVLEDDFDARRAPPINELVGTVVVSASGSQALPLEGVVAERRANCEYNILATQGREQTCEKSGCVDGYAHIRLLQRDNYCDVASGMEPHGV